MARRTFANPVPDIILGDPFVLRWRGRFYMYGTNDGPPLADGRQIPVFRSDDLIHWEPLGGALIPSQPSADHWAPEVLAWNGKFYMAVSFGDVDRTGHALWVAVADRPDGPFTLERRISEPSEKFSIDGSWLLDDDGSLYLFRCQDFVDKAPFGTGIVVQKMRDPLTPGGPEHTVLRAHAPWQTFLANRTMPLYGDRTFAIWTTIEGPAPVKRNGRYYCGYSGGNYTGNYGTGEAVADRPLGPYRDLRGADGPIFATTPGLVEGPGHFSVISPDGLQDWIVLHGRLPGEGGRRVWLCPADWGDDGVSIGPLTDREQPAPRLSSYVTSFETPEMDGWSVDSGTWTCDGGGLLHVGEPGSVSRIVLDASTLEIRGYLEVTLRFLDSASLTQPVAGLSLDDRQGTRWEIAASASREAASVRIAIPGSKPISHGWPTLGNVHFAPAGAHVISLRASGAKTELRLDGMLVGTVEVPFPGLKRLELSASGSIGFESVAIS